MPIVLARIDDRLIHGQVTVAWGAWLSPDRIVLVNDDVAGTDWKRDMYAAADAMGVAVSVVTIDEFVRNDARGDWKDESVIVVFGSPQELLRAVESGANVPVANVGGMHHSEGKREILPYVYVDESDIAAFEALARRGTRIEARDVPQALSVDLLSLLRE